MSNDLIVQLAQGVYDGTTTMQTTDGQVLEAYYKDFNGVQVIFDSYGIAWVTQANIARLLGIDPRNMTSALDNVINAGFISDESKHIIHCMTRIEREGQSAYDTDLAYYDYFMVNLVAARMRKPTPEGILFLEWRERIFQYHQNLVHSLRLEATAKQAQLQFENESLADGYSEMEKDLRTADYMTGYHRKKQQKQEALDRHLRLIDNVED